MTAPDPDRDLEVALYTAKVARTLPNGAAEVVRSLGWVPPAEPGRIAHTTTTEKGA